MTRLIPIGLATVLLAGVVVMAARVGEAARFVTWPVLGFTAVAAGTAILGAWSGLTRPAPFVAGLLLALPVSYVLPVAPMPAVAIVLVGLGALAVAVGAAAGGVAAGVGSLMVLLTVLQGPAIQCGVGSVSSNSGPWWVASTGHSGGSGVSSPDGDAHGTTQVGDRRYEYTCEDGRLTTFHAGA